MINEKLIPGKLYKLCFFSQFANSRLSSYDNVAMFLKQENGWFYFLLRDGTIDGFSYEVKISHINYDRK